MKLLFDQNISFRIVSKLKSYYTDCKHISDVGLNDTEDHIIWQFALVLVPELLTQVHLLNNCLVYSPDDPPAGGQQVKGLKWVQPILSFD